MIEARPVPPPPRPLAKAPERYPGDGFFPSVRTAPFDAFCVFSRFFFTRLKCVPQHPVKKMGAPAPVRPIVKPSSELKKVVSPVKPSKRAKGKGKANEVGTDDACAYGTR